ncbi:MAG: cytidine deaminase [Cytophagales bacterium]|jgi:dCMP deaminase|nr:cytidine deaminase [Cytophagales bacterium]
MNEDREFLKLAYQIAEKSCCKKKKVGCLIVWENKIVSSGYNCIIDHHFNCAAEECHQGFADKCLMVIHAEQNAIVEAVKKNVDFVKATLFISLSPCLSCARLIHGFGIKKIVFAEKFSDYKKNEEDFGLLFLKNLNIEIRQVIL